MLRTAVTLAVAAAFVGTHAKPLGDNPIGVIAAVANELPSSLESVVAVKGTRPGKHLGFDTYKYPGDAVMQAWLLQQLRGDG